MAGFGIYCPKILCIQKIAGIKNITNTHKNFLLNCESWQSWQIFALISLLNVFLPMKSMFIDTLQNFQFEQCNDLFFVLHPIVFPVKIKIIFLY
jgi:hypothetical protein